MRDHQASLTNKPTLRPASVTRPVEALEASSECSVGETRLERLPPSLRSLCPVVQAHVWPRLLGFGQHPKALRVFVEYIGEEEADMQHSPCDRVLSKERQEIGSTLLPYSAKFAAEYLLPQMVRSSPYVTSNPNIAQWRLVETCIQGRGQQGQYMHTAMDLLKASQHGDAWRRSHGHGHAITLTGDHGPCALFKERAGIRNFEPEHRRWQDESMINMTFLQNEGSTRSGCYRPNQDVVIPTPVIQTVEKPSCYRTLEEKSHLAFLAGKSSSKVRARIMEHFADDPDVLIPHSRLSHDKFVCEMTKSVFCLSPRGLAAWSPRLEEALYAGCIPVIIADYYEPPFSHILNYQEFTIRISSDVWNSTKDVLQRVSMAERERLLRNGRAAQKVFRYDTSEGYQGRDMLPLLMFALHQRL